MRVTEFIVSEVGDNPYAFEPYQPPNQAHIKVRARNAIDKIPPNKTTTDVAAPNIKNYSFVTKNGLRYVVILKPSDPDVNGETRSVEISFYAIDRKGRPNFDITGTGDAANVFATVKNVLAKYIEDYNPRYIGFSSVKDPLGNPANDSRFKLYSLFAKNFSRWFPAYTKSWTKDKEDQIVFIFRRSTDNQSVVEQENPKVDLTPNYPNYEVLVGEFLGVKKNRYIFRIVAAELKHGQGPTEKIVKSLTDRIPIGIDIERVKNRKVIEDLSRRGFLGGLGAAALGIAGSQNKSAVAPTPTTAAKPLPVKQLKPLEKVLVAVAQQAGIVGTELKQFLAQCAHETADFTTLREIGNAAYFAKKYDKQYNPARAKILGNIKPGDGIRYKGRGFIQLTGRYNYKKAGESLGLPLEQKPELVEQPDIAAKVAVWFWGNRVQPRVSDFSNVPQSTRPINPALKGLHNRQQHFDTYKQTTLPR